MDAVTTSAMIHVRDDVEITIGATLYDNLAVDLGSNVTVFFTRDAAETLMNLLQEAMKDAEPVVAE